MNYPINHTASDTFVRDLAFKDSAGAAIDLTGAAVAFTVKRDPSDASPLVSASAAITDAAGGLAKVTIPAATMNLPVGVYSYDFQLTDSAGVVTTVLKGPFSVSYQVT